MILVDHHRFSVSRYHAERYPDTAGGAVARGPVVRLCLRFERWLGGRSLEADAFVDPGADETILSLRWIKDFLVAHRLLYVIDGQDEAFSMLLPADEDNRRRRERVLATLAGAPAPMPIGR